jgi:hypothetical protein
VPLKEVLILGKDVAKASVDSSGQVVIPPAPSPEKDKLKKSLLDIESNISSASAKIDAVKEEKVTTTTQTHSIAHELKEHTTHHIIRTTCLIALVLWFFFIIMLSIITESSPFSTMMGLFPVLLTIIVTYILVDHYHLESGFLMVFPVIFTGIFLLMGMGNMLGGVDYANLSVINIVFGLLFEAAITMHHSFLKKHMQEQGEHVVEEKKTEIIVSPEADAAKKELGEVKKELASVKKMIVKLDSEDDVKKFIISIEDKAKAINAVIGRAYSVRHGGTESLRKKIKIDPEHYNEFNELKDKAPNKRRAAAVSILKKINATLDVIEKPEKEVFDSTDLAGLMNLQRDTRGYDRVIDVLAKNDSDPVKLYYEGAREFCREALSALEAK